MERKILHLDSGSPPEEEKMGFFIIESNFLETKNINVGMEKNIKSEKISQSVGMKKKNSWEELEYSKENQIEKRWIE